MECVLQGERSLQFSMKLTVGVLFLIEFQDLILAQKLSHSKIVALNLQGAIGGGGGGRTGVGVTSFIPGPFCNEENKTHSLYEKIVAAFGLYM